MTEEEIFDLYNFCQFLPEDPKCEIFDENWELKEEFRPTEETQDMQEAPEYAEAGAPGSEFWETVYLNKLQQVWAIDPFMGNLVYLGVAFYWVSFAAMDLFRYRTSDDIFKLADIEKDGTNWYKIGTLAQLWTRFVAWTIPLITQALSMFGIAAGLN